MRILTLVALDALTGCSGFFGNKREAVHPQQARIGECVEYVTNFLRQ